MNSSINPYVGKPIRSLQNSLRRIAQSDPDIPQVAPDGVFGAQTRDSVSAFQRKHNLPDTGRVDLETWERIIGVHREILKEEDPPRRIGLYPSAGFRIRVGEINMHLLSITGVLAALAARFPQLGKAEPGDVYTPATEQVVIKLQLAFGMEGDGIITKRFWDTACLLYESVITSLPFNTRQEGMPEEGTGIGM